MLAAPFLGILGSIFGDAGVITDFSGMWFTLALMALITAVSFAVFFSEEYEAGN
jgi:hypothetical protein